MDDEFIAESHLAMTVIPTFCVASGVMAHMRAAFGVRLRDHATFKADADAFGNVLLPQKWSRFLPPAKQGGRSGFMALKPVAVKLFSLADQIYDGSLNHVLIDI